ncbi:MAG: metalloregulator ArsR/SmtB family transcription factor [Candidatus Bathyarchaeota archaeon]|nr:metalloregulator ArsR/SmtB family transcription factor [Candidatus Bathyarchaeota archaeon]
MTQEAESTWAFKAKIFHALSTSERLEIVKFLRDGERCVCEIVPHLNQIQPVVSRHLKILKDAGIVRFRKDGTRRMYAIADIRIFDVVDAITPEFTDSLKKAAVKQVVG